MLVVVYKLGLRLDCEYVEDYYYFYFGHLYRDDDSDSGAHETGHFSYDSSLHDSDHGNYEYSQSSDSDSMDCNNPRKDTGENVENPTSKSPNKFKHILRCLQRVLLKCYRNFAKIVLKIYRLFFPASK